MNKDDIRQYLLYFHEAMKDNEHNEEVVIDYYCDLIMAELDKQKGTKNNE